MVEYCKNDVILLEKIYREVRPYSKIQTSKGVYLKGLRVACPGCGSSNTHYTKKYKTKTGRTNIYLNCRVCLYNWTVPEAKYKKERGDWDLI